ncbi:MAG TPA: TIGR00725 family protein [Actinomycetota bacterium]|nr:TIGR00725 family protein [Actinomycetota bacterium]
MGEKLYVGVVGGSAFAQKSWDDALAIGREIARRGAVLVCGGLGGVMEAACRGAKEGGGTTIAFLPDEDRSRANDHIDHALPTGMGEMRNMLIVRAADVVIAVGGEFGTLSEIGFALRIGKPVVGLETWELAKSGEPSNAIVVAADPIEAVDRALGLVTGT